jgi:hypothetical protein
MNKHENTGRILSELGCSLLDAAGGEIRVPTADVAEAAERAGRGDTKALALLQGADVIWAVSERTGKKLWGFVREPLEDLADNTRPPRILCVAISRRGGDAEELLRVVKALDGGSDPFLFRICRRSLSVFKICLGFPDPSRAWLVLRLLRANGPSLPVCEMLGKDLCLLHGLDSVAEATSGGRTSRPVYEIVARIREMRIPGESAS